MKRTYLFILISWLILQSHIKNLQIKNEYFKDLKTILQYFVEDIKSVIDSCEVTKLSLDVELWQILLEKFYLSFL